MKFLDRDHTILGYVFYMALESYGVLTLKDFLNFWAVIFIIATTLVAILKSEKDVDQSDDQDEPDLGIAGKKVSV